MRTDDFVRPGHINPLRARDGGVLVRTGQTEGSVDLARLAGLYPAAAIIEIMKPDGEMARVPDLEQFCAKHELKMCSVADIIEWRLSDERMVTRLDPLDGAEIETAEGTFRLFAYRSIVDPLPHIALTVGDIGRRDDDGETIPSDEPTLVRMHSRDVLGDVFGVARAGNGTSSGALLRAAMRRIQAEGRGAVVYLRPSMMGGESDALTDRLQTLRLAVDDQVRDDYDQPDLVSATGVGAKAIPVEKRDFGIGGQILRDLGLTKLRVMTNHPRPMLGLASFGIEIAEHVPLDTADQPAV
jgi:3,4-dihydroxy 2-butanone 4-phosphate synthase/GTP cyclohydrolase II